MSKDSRLVNKNKKIFFSLKITFIVLAFIGLIVNVILPLKEGAGWTVYYSMTGYIVNDKYGYIATNYGDPDSIWHQSSSGNALSGATLWSLYGLCVAVSLACVVSALMWTMSDVVKRMNNSATLYSTLGIAIGDIILFNAFLIVISIKTSTSENYWTGNNFYRIKMIAYDAMERYCKIELDPTADMVSHPDWNSIRVSNLYIDSLGITPTIVAVPNVINILMLSLIISDTILINKKKGK